MLLGQVLDQFGDGEIAIAAVIGAGIASSAHASMPRLLIPT